MWRFYINKIQYIVDKPGLNKIKDANLKNVIIYDF